MICLQAENPWNAPPQKPKPEASRPTPNAPNTQRAAPSGPALQAIPPHKVILLAIPVVALVWLVSGFYRVLPEENAVLLRFGKYTQTVTDSGLHYHLPEPIESVMKENVTFERRIEIGYRGQASTNKTARQDIPDESMMLTGDANIVDLDFVVQWKIGNIKDYMFTIREADDTLKRVAESAMREVVGQNNLQDIITDRREDIAARVKVIMQDILTSYHSGMMVTQVLIQDASVPPPVMESFEEVIRATQQAETVRNQAFKYRNEIVPKAQGDAIRAIKEAEGYKEQVVSQAKGDAERFNDVYDSYAKAPEVTRQRLYLEAWEAILKNNDATILDTEKSGTIPYFNLPIKPVKLDGDK